MTSSLITPLRAAFLDALLSSARERFPELCCPVTWASIRRLAARDDVFVEARPFPDGAESPGYLLRSAGRWLVAVDAKLSNPARTVIAAHELAHLWAHHDRDLEASELIVYDRSPEWYDEVREAEADYLAEQMVRGPEQRELPITDRKRARKVTKYAASQIPLGTRKPEPPPLPGWLEEVEHDADAVRLRDNARAVARADAQRYAETHGPLLAGPTIQFSISREAWLSVRLHDAHFPHYETAGAGMFEFVTCTIPAARSIVEQLAGAGHKRTAVFIRRRMREVEKEKDSTE